MCQSKTKVINKKLWEIFKRIIKEFFIVLFNAPIYFCGFIGAQFIYWYTKERGDKRGVLTKRKYRRIKQSVRYKLWVAHNMKWFYKHFWESFEKYEKFYGNKKILKY